MVDADLRQQLAERLIRVAPLLRELYGGACGDVIWQWAVVAADALRGEGPNASPIQTSAYDENPDEHPFLLGLVGHSLQQALNRDLDWTVAVGGLF